MKKNIKKVLIIVLALLVLLTFLFRIRFNMNKDFIDSFNNMVYEENDIRTLNELNFYESYVAIKNYGDYYYKIKDYENALIKYDKALTKRMPKARACETRINAVLSLFQLIDTKDKNHALEQLEKAKSYLDGQEDCLTLPEGNQDRKDAEELIELINQTIECLKNGNCGGSSKKNKDDQDDSKTTEIDPNNIENNNRQGQEVQEQKENEHEDNGYSSQGDRFW